MSKEGKANGAMPKEGKANGNSTIMETYYTYLIRSFESYYFSH